MSHAFGAVAILLLHFAFVLFVVFGALLVARRRWLAWLHLPAAAWGFFVEATGRGCPLTAWENLLRMRAGLDGYDESFVEHYIVALLYPGGLTRELQLALAAGVVLVNLLLYARLFLKRPARMDAG